jgi:hypothetical protein
MPRIRLEIVSLVGEVNRPVAVGQTPNVERLSPCMSAERLNFGRSALGIRGGEPNGKNPIPVAFRNGTWSRRPVKLPQGTLRQKKGAIVGRRKNGSVTLEEAIQVGIFT